MLTSTQAAISISITAAHNPQKSTPVADFCCLDFPQCPPHVIQAKPFSYERVAGWLLFSYTKLPSVPTPAAPHQAGRLILTKAELMASTKCSSSMLTSSAACSWDVDQTKELKVSESCLKRTPSILRAKTPVLGHSQAPRYKGEMKLAWGYPLDTRKWLREHEVLKEEGWTCLSRLARWTSYRQQSDGPRGKKSLPSYIVFCDL